MRNRSLIKLMGAASLAAVVLFSGQHDARAQNTELLVQRLKDRYAATESLRAHFTYQVGSVSDTAASSAGTLFLQGPRYRVETNSQTVVTDGTTTWVYNASENQVIVNDYVEDEIIGLLNQFLFGDSLPFDVVSSRPVRQDGVRYHELAVQPTTPDEAFREATLWMRDDDAVITRLTFIDQNNVAIQFSLQDVDLNPTLDVSTFTFTPPGDAEVIDLRS